MFLIGIEAGGSGTPRKLSGHHMVGIDDNPDLVSADRSGLYMGTCQFLLNFGRLESPGICDNHYFAGPFEQLG